MRTATSGVSAAWDDLNQVAVQLTSAGFRPGTDGATGTPPPAPDSLEHLRRIEQSRKETQDLLAAIEVLLPLAEALDQRRGNWVGDMADTERGETPGTDFAEAIQELVLRLRGELGAEGSGRE
jgi:hypothetical protein